MPLYELKRMIQKELLTLINQCESEEELLFKLAGFYGDIRNILSK